MFQKRWIVFLFSILAGIGLGLLYGWVISPVEYVDTSPDTLRADFRADYALMVAEIYQVEQNAEGASRRLAALGAKPPVQIVEEALEFAQNNHFSQDDIALLQSLSFGLQTFQPAGSQP